MASGELHCTLTTEGGEHTETFQHPVVRVVTSQTFWEGLRWPWGSALKNCYSRAAAPAWPGPVDLISLLCHYCCLLILRGPFFSHSESGVCLILTVSYHSCWDIVVIACAGMNLVIAIHFGEIMCMLLLCVEFNCCLKTLPFRTYSIMRC